MHSLVLMKYFQDRFSVLMIYPGEKPGLLEC